jgi:acyl-CoA dehydrogenase
MPVIVWVAASVAAGWLFAAAGAPLWLVTVMAAGLLGALQGLAGPGGAVMAMLWAAFALAAAVLNVAPLRRALVSGPLLAWFRRVLPPMSPTEQEALEAGSVWWDGELFSGAPDWRRLHGFPVPALSAEERDFLDGPVEALCAMLDDWQVSHELNDLPPEAWRFIREQGFLGMIIPKRYGGLGFSAMGHSTVVAKLATRTPAGTVSVMVPNSLGPAELLLHYGTEAQKDHWLPRLARGLEMPCFALTGPEAGSDAGSIPDTGVVCRGLHEGREVLGLRLTWNKRYITLAPVATVLGLAFRARDPQRLLGGEEDLGITLALIPARHPGVQIGRRHMPLNGSFMNGPTRGSDVFIPLDWVIGGRERVGQGWRMLMECLAAGRSISLPSSSAGVAKLAALATGAYARVRTQFRTPVARFEGVEEALARIAGNAYAIEAARVMTAGAVDLGEKPAVVSAIVKYHATERARQVINDAMDVHGGKGICLGPGNYLGRAYQQVPIAITVEGANILTRSMIIFGQGAIRCHPWVLREMAATREADAALAVRQFDTALRGHVSFALSNFARALFHGITGARFVPGHGPAAVRPYYREMGRLSAAFAFAADVAMLTLGGSLKRREKLSARLGDVLSQLYLASAVLKRFADDGHPSADLPLVQWCLRDALHRAEQALAGVVANFPSGAAALLLRLAAIPLGLRLAAPSDQLGAAVARLITEAGEVRERLSREVFLPQRDDDPVGRLRVALELLPTVEALEARLRQAAREGRLAATGAPDRLAGAQAAGLLSAEEAALLARYERIRLAAIAVDDFPHEVGRALRAPGPEARVAA